MEGSPLGWSWLRSDENGQPTADEELAATDPETGEAVANPARNIWITSTALTTALNTSYLAERISLFGIVVGIALLLSGIGFTVLALGGALRHRAESIAPAPRPTAAAK